MHCFYIFDKKLDQLQCDLCDTDKDISLLREDLVKTKERLAKQEDIIAVLVNNLYRAKLKCIVYPQKESFNIYSYQPDNVGYLIGNKGHRIKKMEIEYGIYIKIPPKDQQRVLPIIIKGRYFTCATKITAGVYHVCNILNGWFTE